MTNEEFQIELRREIKVAKRQFLDSEQYPKVYRQWNLYKVQLKALQILMQRFDSMQLDELESLIRKNPTWLKFLNDCLNIMPDMLRELKQNDYAYIFDKFYTIKRKEMDRIKAEKHQNLNQE